MFELYTPSSACAQKTILQKDVSHKNTAHALVDARRALVYTLNNLRLQRQNFTYNLRYRNPYAPEGVECYRLYGSEPAR